VSPWLVAALVASQMWDATSSHHALAASPYNYEANWALRPVSQNIATEVAGMAIIDGGITLLMPKKFKNVAIGYEILNHARCAMQNQRLTVSLTVKL
jgi:hypothetical protein